MATVLVLLCIVGILLTTLIGKVLTVPATQALAMNTPPVASAPLQQAPDPYLMRVRNDKRLQAYLNRISALSDKAAPEYCGSAGCFTPEIESIRKKMQADGYVEIQYPVDCDANACGGAWAYKDWPEVSAYEAHLRIHPNDSGSTPLFKVSAVQYNSEYKENEVAADTKYKGKALALNGDVSRVGKAINGENFIGLRAGAYSEVAIYGVSTQEAIDLKAGQNVTVSCTGDGMTLQIATCRIPAKVQ